MTLGAVVVAWATPGCYGAGGGSAPPLNSFYFPTGLAVSPGGNVLYAINSDFDLQYSGGTLQSYDLYKIRVDAAGLIEANLSGGQMPDCNDPGVSQPCIPFITKPVCPGQPGPAANGRGVYLGQGCAPPVDSTKYVRDSVITGAFATDLKISPVPFTTDGDSVPHRRLFSPVGGNATVTWADIHEDDPASAPAPDGSDGSTFNGFPLDCGVGADNRCDGEHQTGNNPNSDKNSRNATMPGDPFGIALTEDASAIAVTSQVDTKTSLLTSGLGISRNLFDAPTMQFVLDGMPTGGVGIASVPHDPDAVTRCEDVGNVPPCVRQAFLQTSRAANEIDLLRYYDDDGSAQVGASQRRPFLTKEATYAVTSNSNGSDSRGIAIDATPRMACKAALGKNPPADKLLACAQIPANVFIANRTPSTIVVGQLGKLFPDGSYDPDYLTIIGNVPLTDGPSKVFLAPVVNRAGNYELRLVVVCYDTNSIFIFDPSDVVAQIAVPLAIIPTGFGPYAVAFDPFSLGGLFCTQDDVDAGVCTADQLGRGKPVLADKRADAAAVGLKSYRFMYVASFRESYVQVIDLDESNADTFQRVVFTLGQPTPPKGT
jgi:hypothetical protein